MSILDTIRRWLCPSNDTFSTVDMDALRAENEWLRRMVSGQECGEEILRLRKENRRLQGLVTVVNLSTYNGEVVEDIVRERDALRAGIGLWQHAIDCDWRTQNVCTCGLSEARKDAR